MKITPDTFKDFLYQYRIHFIGWFLFIFYEVVIMGVIRGVFATFGNYALFYAFNILLFYFHALVVMPAAKMKSIQALWRLPLFISVEVALYIPFVLHTADFFNRIGWLTLIEPIQFTFRSHTNVAYRAIYFILFATGYDYILNYFKERKRAEEQEKERLLVIIENQRIYSDLIKSQHAHLKAQINPHFLFNTLNFIYTSTRKTAPEAAEAIMALSEMMRYSIEEVKDHAQSALSGELEQIENLIKLHQIKAGHSLHIALNYGEDVEQLQIIPLLIMTLVENMFKHGELRQAAHLASIDICCSSGILKVSTKNLIALRQAHTSHHIGLSNVKKRLKSAYGSKAALYTDVTEDHYFHATLTIELNQV